MGAAVWLALALAWLPARPAAAHTASADLRDVGLDDRTGQKVPLDVQFSDESGGKRPLSAYLAERYLFGRREAEPPSDISKSPPERSGVL